VPCADVAADVVGVWFGIKQLLRADFLQRLICDNGAAASRVLTHLCFQNTDTTLSLTPFLRTLVINATQHQVSADIKQYFKALTVSCRCSSQQRFTV
jgi:hypothetical protein